MRDRCQGSARSHPEPRAGELHPKVEFGERGEDGEDVTLTPRRRDMIGIRVGMRTFLSSYEPMNRNIPASA